jgi:hypothetical protein
MLPHHPRLSALKVAIMLGAVLCAGVLDSRHVAQGGGVSSRPGVPI